MTRLQRLKREFRGMWDGGRSIAGRVHVWATARELIAAVRSKLKAEVRRGRLWRDHRHAAYRGAIEAQRQHRELVRRYRL